MAEREEAEKRREIRRKNILENAEKRLLKLTKFENKTENDSEQEMCNGSVVDRHCMPTTPSQQSIRLDSTPVDIHLAAKSEGEIQPSEIRNRKDARRAKPMQLGDRIESPPMQQQQDSKDSSNYTASSADILFHRRKIFATLLALIVRIVIYFSSEMTIFTYILMPITTFEIGLAIASAMSKNLKPTKGQPNFPLLALLLLLGFKNGLQISHAYNVCVMIFEDYALFLFTFFISHCFIETFVNFLERKKDKEKAW